MDTIFEYDLHDKEYDVDAKNVVFKNPQNKKYLGFTLKVNKNQYNEQTLTKVLKQLLIHENNVPET